MLSTIAPPCAAHLAGGNRFRTLVQEIVQKATASPTGDSRRVGRMSEWQVHAPTVGRCTARLACRPCVQHQRKQPQYEIRAATNPRGSPPWPRLNERALSDGPRLRP